MCTRAREISANENGQQQDPSVDQMIGEVVKDPAMGTSANFLFTRPDGKEGAFYQYGEGRRGRHVLVERSQPGRVAG